MPQLLLLSPLYHLSACALNDLDSKPG